jgi:hypothetical protein
MMSLEAYRHQRDALLTKITEVLSIDRRFVAAWLTGSLSRNDEDSLSDLDLRLVVSNEFSPGLCSRLEQVSAQTSPERHALFRQFGTPALIHENNNNAPEGGTFTFVLYAESTVMIDWVLVPQGKAIRPIESRLLFEKAFIPVAPPPEPDDLKQSRKEVSQQWAFFWMMTAVTIKYIFRNDGVFAAEWTEHLHQLLREIVRRLDRQPWSYVRSSLSKLQPTREKQLQSIQELCNRMLELKPRVSAFLGWEPLTPTTEIEGLLSLVHDTNRDT